MSERTEKIPLTFTQRWNTYLALIMAALVVSIGLAFRNGTLSSTQTFEDLEAGVRAQVPLGWLLDTNSADYVFRVQDPNALPFKTTLQVSVLTVGPDATPNLVLDLLYLDRAPAFFDLSRDFALR